MGHRTASRGDRRGDLTGLALIARADAYRAEVLRRKRIGLRPASFGEWLEREGVDRLDGHSDGGEQGQFFERHGAGHPATALRAPSEN